MLDHAGDQLQIIGQAGRIDGMTPAAVTLLLAVIRRGEFRKAS